MLRKILSIPLFIAFIFLSFISIVAFTMHFYEGEIPLGAPVFSCVVALLFLFFALWTWLGRLPFVSPAINLSKKPALSQGFLESQRYQSSKNVSPENRALNDEIELICQTIFTDGAPIAFDRLSESMKQTGREALIKETAIAAFPSIVKLAMDDSLYSEEEENAINSFYELTQVKVDSLPSAERNHLEKAALIRDLINGVKNPRFHSSSLPFNFTKKETLIWAFAGVEAYEHREKIEYKGGSQGLSIRIANGVYWRTGASKGERVSRIVQDRLGTGVLAITDTYVYYQAGGDFFRIRHDKIVGYRPTAESVIVFKDGARAKPLEFIVDDPWFAINILQNASNWSQ